MTIDELPAKTLFWQQDFPDNAAGKLSFGMMVLLAKHYIDNLSDEVKKAWPKKSRKAAFRTRRPSATGTSAKAIELVTAANSENGWGARIRT